MSTCHNPHSEAMSTEDFLRKVVFKEKKVRYYKPWELPDGVSTEEFLRKVVFGVEVEDKPGTGPTPSYGRQRPR